jgi:hypothetical protein
MKFTNRFGYPEPVFRALCNDEYEKHGDFSVTELIGPPQIAILRQRHGDKIVMDASSNAWSLESTALHNLLSTIKLPGAIAEERFIVNVLGKQISMKPDYAYRLKDGTYHLLDNKRVSWKAVKSGPKDEWIKQTNIYAWGLRQRGFNVSKIGIVCYFRDWSYMECHIKRLRDYPESEIGVLDIPVWPDDRIQTYLEERIRIHADARLRSDENLPNCTMDERWADPDCFAVVFTEGKSKGNAVPGGSSFDTLAEAQSFMSKRLKTGSKDKQGARVEHRPGTSKRCERGYCPVAQFCCQYNKDKQVDPF